MLEISFKNNKIYIYLICINSFNGGKNMKYYKLLAIFMALSMIFTGCVSRDNDKENSSEESSSSSSSETSEITVNNSAEEIPADEVTNESSEESSEESAPEEEDVELPPPDLDKISKLSGEYIPWGPGVHKDNDGRPIACTGLQEKYGKYDAHFIAPMEKKIYLTFDEGYENGNTANILDVLKEKDVSAVFFVTLEYAKRNPELIQRMIDEGHIVGNHSAGHPNYTKISLEEAMDATMKLHQYMLDEYDYKMTLFRYPEGAFSEQVAALLQSLGYKQVFWSFAYADWDPKNQMAPDAAFEKVYGATHDGAIYLLHAVSETNSNILGKLIDTWRNDGYEIPRYDVEYDLSESSESEE